MPFVFFSPRREQDFWRLRVNKIVESTQHQKRKFQDMAIYAPTRPNVNERIKVASLVEANQAADPPAASLTSLAVDGTRYGVMGPLVGRDGEVPYLGR